MPSARFVSRYSVLSVSALGLAAALYGCGGGGGSDGGPQINVPDENGPPPAAADPFLDTASDVDQLLAAGVRLSRSKPAFGSVTQSTNRDAAGVTTDRASTRWDGQKLRVNVVRSGGSSMTFEGDFRNGQTRLLERSGRNSQRFALITVNWSDEDRSDYQAGGTWIHATGDPKTHRYTSVEIGTFADGSGMSVSDPIELPASGRARYEGTAKGYYGISYGGGFEDDDIPSGSLEYGTFSSPVELEAVFGEEGSTVSGCINCGGGARVEGEYYEYDAASGKYLDEEDVYGPAPIAMAFPATPIDGSGAFSSNLSGIDEAGLEPDRFSVSDTLYQGFRVSGTWGGVLSREPNTDGVPSGIVATFGAEGRHPLGTRAAFAGYVNSTVADAAVEPPPPIEPPEEGTILFGRWKVVEEDGNPIGVKNGEYNLFTLYDAGLANPTLTAPSASAQPAGAGPGTMSLTWLGEWAGLHGDDFELSDRGEARVDVEISVSSVDATLTYSGIDIPSVPRTISTAPAPVSDGRFAPSVTIGIEGASVTFGGEGQFGGADQRGVAGYIDGPGFRSIFAGDRE